MTKQQTAALLTVTLSEAFTQNPRPQKDEWLTHGNEQQLWEMSIIQKQDASCVN